MSSPTTNYSVLCLPVSPSAPPPPSLISGRPLLGNVHNDGNYRRSAHGSPWFNQPPSIGWGTSLEKGGRWRGGAAEARLKSKIQNVRRTQRRGILGAVPRSPPPPSPSRWHLAAARICSVAAAGPRLGGSQGHHTPGLADGYRKKSRAAGYGPRWCQAGGWGVWRGGSWFHGRPGAHSEGEQGWAGGA